MRMDRGRAVAASALPDQTAEMRQMLEHAGFSEVICVSDGVSALKQARSRVTELILADVVLPVLDGAELSRRLFQMPLAKYPEIILLGASAVCPENAARGVLKRPVRREDFLEILDGLDPAKRKIPDCKHARVCELLDMLGVPRHPGRDYLVRAIEMTWLDSRLSGRLTTRLYPAVAEQFGVNPRQAERAMRHAVEVAWRSGEMEAQYKLFGDTIDARRGSPTLGEMIAQIADILRWEGKA